MYGQSFLTVQLPSGRKHFLSETVLKGKSVRKDGNPLLYSRTADQKNGKWHLLMEGKNDGKISCRQSQGTV